MKSKKTRTINEIQLTEEKLIGISIKKYYFLIGILTFFVFANTIYNGYNLDDELVTRNHPLTSQGLKAVVVFFTSPYYQDNMGYAYGYRPIVHLSFAIEHELFGEKASVSHFVNVILFVGCVLLLFSLLLKWVGEQNKWLVIVAVLFFALHPIHTEVVASIKNRDELLAFLFAMLAGLSMIKFIEREKWISLFWIVIFFSIGILSKKSIYAMSVVFPISAILLNSISWKNLVYILLVFSLPAALISSESSVSKFLILFMIPWLGSFVFYYFREKLFSGESFVKLIIQDFNFWAGITLFISLFGIYNSNYFLIPVMILSSFYCFYLNTKKGVLLVSLLAAIIGLRFNIIEFAYFGFIILGNFTFKLFSKKEKTSVLNISVLVIISTVVFIINPIINQVLSIFAIAVFIWLLNKKVIFGVLFSAIVLIIAYLISQTINSFGIIMFPFSLLLLVSFFFKSYKLVKLIPLLALIPVFFIPHFSNNYVNTRNVNTITNSNVKSESSANQKILIEGRRLEYVENTLIANHTSSERIGTGLSTIGEYSKLLAFPYELSFYYGFSKINTVGFNTIWVWISLIFHLVLIVLAIWHLKKNLIISIGVVWYLLSVLLFSNWFELVAGMVGERLAFTASAGFSIFFAGIIYWIKPDFNIKRPKILEFLVIVVLVLFSIRTISRNSEWNNPIRLMGNDIKHLQNSAQANNLYALNLMKISSESDGYSISQRLEMQKKAAKHFKQAILLYPYFLNANYDFARTSLLIGDTINAITYYNKSIKLDSTFSSAYLEMLSIYETKNEKLLYLQLARNLFNVNKEPEIFIILAKAYLANNLPLNAKNILRKGLAKYPNNDFLKLSLNEIAD